MSYDSIKSFTECQRANHVTNSVPSDSNGGSELGLCTLRIATRFPLDNCSIGAITVQYREVFHGGGFFFVFFYLGASLF